MDRVVVGVKHVLSLYHVVEPEYLYKYAVEPLPLFCVAFIVIVLHVGAHAPAIVMPLAVKPVLQLYRA